MKVPDWMIDYILCRMPETGGGASHHATVLESPDLCRRCHAQAAQRGAGGPSALGSLGMAGK